jgi:hypothetical protein
MIYLWQTPSEFFECEEVDDLERYVGLYNSQKGPDCALLNGGSMEPALWSCTKADLEFEFEVSKLELQEYDVTSVTARFIVVNQRVRNVLEKFAKDDLQFIPVTMICNDGTLDGYYAVNILSRVKGIDKQKSTIEWSTSDPAYIQGFGVGVGGLGNHHIAREEEFVFVLVSQELKDALCSLSPPIKGVTFAVPEERYW